MCMRLKIDCYQNFIYNTLIKPDNAMCNLSSDISARKNNSVELVDIVEHFYILEARIDKNLGRNYM